jgi:NAD(P)-dependent dehydrogenase (short-subunit alcohol dehydrogenase family)
MINAGWRKVGHRQRLRISEATFYKGKARFGGLEVTEATVDHEFTAVGDVAEAAVFLASFASNALTGRSLIVSHGWCME